jgi:hypothetical protein
VNKYRFETLLIFSLIFTPYSHAATVKPPPPPPQTVPQDVDVSRVVYQDGKILDWTAHRHHGDAETPALELENGMSFNVDLMTDLFEAPSDSTSGEPSKRQMVVERPSDPNSPLLQWWLDSKRGKIRDCRSLVFTYYDKAGQKQKRIDLLKPCIWNFLIEHRNGKAIEHVMFN